MQQYTNAYNIAVDNDSKMTIINFLQRGPKFDDNGPTGVETTQIASVVMNNDMAEALSEALKTLIDQSEAEESEE